MNHYILDNGVEVVLKSTSFSNTVTMQVWVGVGSLHENESEKGMSHFLEHMLFKGTRKYGPGEIASTVEMCGGEINAYTTFDNTVYYLTLDSDHAHDGLDLLYEAVAYSKLDEVEFNREKEVILEEIRRSNDSPGAKIGRKVFELCYNETQAAKAIIGTSESVTGFTRDEVYAYFKKWYVPNNMRIIVVGKFDEEEMLKLIDSTYGEMSRQELPFYFDPMAIYEKRSPPHAEDRASVIKGDFKQVRLEVVFPAPFLEHPDTMSLDIAAFALGTGEMSRLTRRLRDELGLVSSIGASVFSPVFGGLFEISALLEEKDLNATLTAIREELISFLTTSPITDEELARSRATLRVDRIYRDETVDGQARSIGFGLKTKLRMHFDAVFSAMIDDVSRSEVHGAAKRWLNLDNARVVVLVHDDSKLTPSDLGHTFWQVEPRKRAERAPSFLGGTSIITTADNGDVSKFKISDGITLLTKQNSSIPLFTIVGAARGGIREERRDQAGSYNFLAGMMATATESMPFQEFVGTVEAHGASLEGFSGKDSFGIHAQCAVDDFQIFLPMVIKSLTEPSFPADQFQSLKREITQSLIRQKDSPSSVCFRRLQQLIYGDHPYSWPVAGLEEPVQAMTSESLMEFYRAVAPGKGWVFSVVSPFDHETTHSILEPFLKQIDSGTTSKLVSGNKSPDIVGHEVEHIPMDREQSHIAVGFPGLTWGDADRPALDVLINVLGGHGGRLFRELRDKESFAYTVSPVISYGCDRGIVGAYIACAPAKADLALNRLLEEMQKIATKEPTADEVKRSINYIVGSHAMGLQKCDSQASTMALMELYGYGFDDFKSYPGRIKKVTAREVQAIAKKMFRETAYRAVIVGPA